MHDLPASTPAALAATSIRHDTPCGEGLMVWREWGSGETVALLHGGGGSWRHWVRTIPALAAHYRVLAADMPGYGESDLPPEPVTFASLGAIIAHGLDLLTPAHEGYHIAGFSLGSFVAPHVMAATARPARSLTLAHGHMVGKMAYSPQQTLKRWRNVEDLAERRAILRHNLGQLMLAHPESADDATVELYREDLEQARLRVPGFIDQLDTDILTRIPGRLCSISGALDPTSAPSLEAQIEALRALRPDSRSHIIPNAGHWVMHEAPEAFNALFLDWLGS